MTQTRAQVAQSQAEPTALYCLFSATETLLYVGISKHPTYRMEEHSRSKAWWHQVSSNMVDWFDDRPSAKYAETELIRRFTPVYNIAEADLEQVQTAHGLWCPDCWNAGRSVGVQPWDDVPDHASQTWRSAYTCRKCAFVWSVSWHYPSGERMENEVYDPWAVLA